MQKEYLGTAAALRILEVARRRIQALPPERGARPRFAIAEFAYFEMKCHLRFS